jgi:Protein of unknown function (DUF3341)
MKTEPKIFGVIAEFDDHEALLRAAREAFVRGYRKMDAFTPFPVEGLSEAIGFRKNRVSLCCLLGGLAGGIGGYFMQWFASVVDYPLNVGGRPFHSIPSFIPITFELTVLCGAIATILGMLALNGLPRPHHPVFSARNFQRATLDGFFLCIEATDRKFNREAVMRFWRELNPRNVSEVRE